jgi:hypothetical protein
MDSSQIDLFEDTWAKMQSIKLDDARGPFLEVRWLPYTGRTFLQQFVLGGNAFLAGFSLSINKSIIPEFDWDDFEKCSIWGFQFDQILKYTNSDITDISLVGHRPFDGMSFYKCSPEKMFDLFRVVVDEISDIERKEYLKKSLFDLGLYRENV